MADQPTPGENPTEPVVAAVAPATASAPVVTETPSPAVVPPVIDPVAPTVVAPVVGIPEKYDLKLGDVPVNQSLLDAVSPIFKKSGMTNEAAQELATAFAAHQKALIPQIMERDLEALKADKTLGGLNLARTQSRVNDALAAFTTPQERDALTAMGIANNPNLVRMFYRIGSSMQDAPQTDAGPQVREKPSRATKLYGGGDAVRTGRAN